MVPSQMKRSRWAALLTTVTGLVCLVTGCVSVPVRFQQPTGFVIIEYNFPDAERVAFRSGQSLVPECEHLFPGYKRVPEGERGPGWPVKYEVFFFFRDAVALTLSSNGKVWTMGRGYIPVNGDLRAFFLKVRGP